MKVLMVLAHADDEILWGYPILQDDRFDVELLICSSDLHNPQRQAYAGRREALREVCDFHGIPFTCWDYDSEFYRLANRPTPSLQAFSDLLADYIDNSGAEMIFTHNPHGEYGHLDHRLLFQLVAEHAGRSMLITDIHRRINWPIGTPPSLYYRSKVAEYCLDMEQFERCKDIYVRRGCWTWDFLPVEKCSLFRIEP